MKNIPAAFAEYITADLGEETAAPLLCALREEQQSQAVRLNPAKPSPLSPEGESVEWWDAGRYYSPEESFTLDPVFHAGGYYVQDSSSMFVAHVVRELTRGMGPLVVIDACAAPGGKTTAAIDALPAGSLVIANEIVPARCAVLKENIIKWGYPSAIVTRGDTAALSKLGPVADIVIADVPCSGEGMMRKEQVAAEQWSRGLVEACVVRQQEIVDNLWKTIRPGGYMIYSTCTFNRSEDELMVRYIIDHLGGMSVRVPSGDFPSVAPAIGDDEIYCYRFMPHLTSGGGLFMAVIQKPGQLSPHTLKPQSGKNRGKEKVKILDGTKSLIAPAEEMTFNVADDHINAFPSRWQPLLRRIDDTTDLLHHGIPVATIKGRDIIPAHALALSAALAPDAFPRVALDKSQALEYLRRNPIAMPDGTPRGYVIVTYGGLPLGFVKNLGNRANNLYPPDYRIRFK
ncbi:MAG: hypothetical protein NC098_04680 [Lachnoclostridium sp.]|nr:hypothetical protein [Lachnoclostridium sp.]